VKVEQEEKKGSIRKAYDRVSQWFSADEPTVPKAAPVGMDQSLEIPAQEEQSETVEGYGEISQAVMTISEKVAVLKNTFEFDKKLESRLTEVHTYRELILYYYDVLLVRFTKLREIGIVNQDSSELISRLNEKTTSMLASASISASETNAPSLQELQEENERLRKEIAALHERYLKTGIITDTELALEKEVKYLQSRLREQQTKMSLAAKKLKALLPYQEMSQSLRAKNSILQSKVDHQARLLKSLTADSPKQQQLVSGIDRLRVENRQLNEDLEKQAGLLAQLKTLLPSESRHILDELIDSNTRLHTEFEEKRTALEGVLSARGSEESLLETIDRLSEENAQLTGRLGTHQQLSSYLDDHRAGKADVGNLVQLLTAKNEQLKLELEAKEERIQVLSSDSSDRPAVKAYWQLQHKYKQLFMESRAREQFYTQARDERKNLIAQASERTALIKENQRLKTELDSKRRIGDVLRKLEFQCTTLKRERGEFRTKSESLAVQNADLEQKLSKISAEYRLLLKEYENIFEGS
jgi:DNA repair exonuclease SbcCD ATPase subunit